MRRSSPPEPEKPVWRIVKQISHAIGGDADKAKEFSEHTASSNHAVEARFEGPWLFIRSQKTPDSEVFEYALPHTAVHYVVFWNEGEN